MRLFAGALTAAAFALSLSACGNPTQQPAAPATAAQTPPTIAPVAPPQPQAACPAQIRTPPRSRSAPIDDVVGLRVGLTLAEAENIVRCQIERVIVTDTDRSSPVAATAPNMRWGFNAQTQRVQTGLPPAATPEEFNRRKTDEENRVRHRNEVAPGEERFEVLAIGPPQQERVYALWRQVNYPLEARQPVVALAEELRKKYKTPSFEYGNSFYWAYDVNGGLLPEGSNGFVQCAQALNASAGSSFFNQYFRPLEVCGVTIVAFILPSDNPDLAAGMQVMIVNQERYLAAVASAEQAVAQAREDARRAEIERARAAAGAPKL